MEAKGLGRGRTLRKEPFVPCFEEEGSLRTLYQRLALRGLEFPPRVGWHSSTVNGTSKDLQESKCPGVFGVVSCDWSREWVGLENQ